VETFEKMVRRLHFGCRAQYSKLEKEQIKPETAASIGRLNVSEPLGAAQISQITFGSQQVVARGATLIV
jgi:hypothetical protein